MASRRTPTDDKPAAKKPAAKKPASKAREPAAKKPAIKATKPAARKPATKGPATKVAKKPAAGTSGEGADGGDALHFVNARPARTFASLTPTEQKHLGEFAEIIEEQSEFGDVQAVDVVRGDSGPVIYHLYWWPIDDGVLVEAATGDVIADLADASFGLREPNKALREALSAAFDESQETLGLELSMFFSSQGETERAAPRPERAASEKTDANGASKNDEKARGADLSAFSSFDWKSVASWAGGPKGVPQREWFERFLDPKFTPAKAVDTLRSLRWAVVPAVQRTENDIHVTRRRFVAGATALTVDLFAELLKDPACRAHAALLEFVGSLRIGDTSSDPLLGPARKSDEAGEEVLAALERLAPVAVPYLRHRDPATRAAAAWALGHSRSINALALREVRGALAREEDTATAIALACALAAQCRIAGQPFDEPLAHAQKERSAAVGALLVLTGKDYAPEDVQRLGLLARFESALALPDAPVVAAPAKGAPRDKVVAPAPMGTFHFAGGQLANLVLLALAKLEPDPAAIALTDKLLDDNTRYQGSTIGQHRAGLVVKALPLEPDGHADLSPEQRRVLDRIAQRPQFLRSVIIGDLSPRGLPSQVALLRRWLGTLPPSPLGQTLASGETVLDTILAAIRGGAPLVEPARRLASSLTTEDAITMAYDLLTYAEGRHSAVADLPMEKYTPEWGALSAREQSRRSVRLWLIVRDLLVARGELTPLLAHLREVCAQPDAVATCVDALSPLVLAAQALARGAPLDLPAGFTAALEALAEVMDFVPQTTALLAMASPGERAEFLSRPWQHAPLVWPYLALVPAESLPGVVEQAWCLPVDELTQQALDRMPIDQAKAALAVLVERYGQQEHNRKGHELELRAGELRAKVWASPKPALCAELPVWDGKV